MCIFTLKNVWLQSGCFVSATLLFMQLALPLYTSQFSFSGSRQKSLWVCTFVHVYRSAWPVFMQGTRGNGYLPPSVLYSLEVGSFLTLELVFGYFVGQKATAALLSLPPTLPQ